MNKPIIYVLLASFLTACMTPTPLSPRPDDWAKELKADANFYQVDDKLYRSEQPVSDDLDHIHAQNIKTIINLQPDNSKNLALFDKQTQLVNIPLYTWKVRPHEIARVLYAIEQKQQHGAVLLHCRHGADRTGVVIAMYRIIYQGWDIQKARKEMKYGDYGYHVIWKNLDNLLNEISVLQVKTELEKLRKANS